MCIIVYKPINETCPSWKTLKQCFENNPDGCGFMFAEDGRVTIHKGFMSWRSFKTAFKPYKNRTDIPMVLHFRITTHGETSPECTHPFPLSNSKAELKKLNNECEIGIAHNGIISMVDGGKGMSDTMEFIKEYAGVIITSPVWYERHNASQLLADVIKSKMLVLSENGHAEIVGTGWTHDDGIWYSNTSYRPWSYTPSSIDWSDVYSTYYDSHREYCPIWDTESPAQDCELCTEQNYCWSEYEMELYLDTVYGYGIKAGG